MGDIIVAVNPYKPLKIYEKEVRLGKWHAMMFGSIFNLSLHRKDHKQHTFTQEQLLSCKIMMQATSSVFFIPSQFVIFTLQAPKSYWTHSLLSFIATSSFTTTHPPFSSVYSSSSSPPLHPSTSKSTAMLLAPRTHPTSMPQLTRPTSRWWPQGATSAVSSVGSLGLARLSRASSLWRS